LGLAVNVLPEAPVFHAYVPGMEGVTVAVTVPGLPAQITDPVVVTTGEGLMTTVVVAVPMQAPIFTVTE
jgi:hypothetical protein